MRRVRSAFTLIEPFDPSAGSGTAVTLKAHSFTLIELLVVIAIIGVLASLLLPALQVAKSKAVIASCQNTQHQAFIALTAYADDYNEFPTVGQILEGFSMPTNWLDFIPGQPYQYFDAYSGHGGPAWFLIEEGRYVPSRAMVACPTQKPLGATDGMRGYWPMLYHYMSPDAQYYTTAAYSNGAGIVRLVSMPPSVGWSYRDKRDPAAFGLLTCRLYRYAFGGLPSWEPHYPQPVTWPTVPQLDHEWQTRERNNLFADGHATYESKR